MKKLIYNLIILAFAIVLVSKSFAQSFQMKINNQEVANVFGQVCLSHKDSLGDNLRVEVRKLEVGEVVEINNGKPAGLSAGDHPAIYIQDFYQTTYWDNTAIENWKRRAVQSLNRNDEEILLNNFVKTNEFKGYVLSSDTLSRIMATISVVTDSGQLLTTIKSDINGKFSVKLPVGKYLIEVKAENFLPYFDSIFISKEKSVLMKDFILTRVENGNKIVLKNVFFEFGKAILKPESKPQLDALASFLKENIGIEIELSGHTDNKGKASFNLKLSKKRAKAVLNYLVQNGVAKERLEFKGYGSTQPIALNSKPDGSDNPEGRQENRRTEFKILRVNKIAVQ